MKDRLIFETTKLDNGITVYAKKMDVPFAIAWLYIPVGHVHNTGPILSGTAHFIEHLAYNRSHLYPERNQFKKKIALKGGKFDASTDSLQTEYNLAVPSDMFSDEFKGLMSHVFEPLIKPEDIPLEARIIANERKRKSKWFPGDNNLQHHCMTKWKCDMPFTIRQRLGEDPDLKKMTVARLTDLHEAYFDPRAYLIVGGNFDSNVVFKELGKLKTKKHDLPMKFEQIRWANREYHEEKFDDIARFIYHLGGINAGCDPVTAMGISFIGNLLVNSVHGALHQWLRDELGWCYNIGFDFSLGNSEVWGDWELYLPVNTYEQAQQVRKELHDRILAAISDEKYVTIEVERRKSAQLFAYQTLNSVLSEADKMLEHTGKLYNEAEFLKIYDHWKDTSYLKELYDKHWSPQVTGEFLALPQ